MTKVLLNEMVAEARVEKVGKSLKLQGQFMTANIVNRNNRRYGLDLLKQSANELQESIAGGTCYSQLGHPEGPQPDLPKIAGLVESFRHKGGNAFWGSIKILPDMPMGKIAETLLSGGAKLSASARAVGQLRKGKDGVDEVVADGYKLISFDIVPLGGFSQAVCDNVREIIQDGSLSINESASALSLLQSFEKDRARTFDYELSGSAAFPSIAGNPEASMTHLERLEAEKADILQQLADLQSKIDMQQDGISQATLQRYVDQIADPITRAVAQRQLNSASGSKMQDRAAEFLSRWRRATRDGDYSNNRTFLHWLAGRDRS
jgi:hypothetical protein